MQLGFLSRTSRGRCVTPGAYRHLGMTPPADLTQQQPEAAEDPQLSL